MFVVTIISTVPVPAGAVAVMDVPLTPFTVKLVAGTPPKSTAVTVPKPASLKDPAALIVTVVPGTPLTGLIDPTCGKISACAKGEHRIHPMVGDQEELGIRVIREVGPPQLPALSESARSGSTSRSAENKTVWRFVPRLVG